MKFTRQEARRIKREIQRLDKKFFGHCTICKRPFPDWSQTYIGFDEKHDTQIAGTCCQGKIKVLFGGGTWSNGGSKITVENYDRLVASHPILKHIPEAKGQYLLD